jgi:hypothetical protein
LRARSKAARIPAISLAEPNRSPLQGDVDTTFYNTALHFKNLIAGQSNSAQSGSSAFPGKKQNSTSLNSIGKGVDMGAEAEYGGGVRAFHFYGCGCI